MWKYFALLLLVHISMATIIGIPSPSCESCAQSIDEQERIEDELDSYISCEPSNSCPGEDDDDSDESDEDCDDNDDNDGPSNSNVCNCNNGPYGGCSPLPSPCTRCNGAVNRAIQSIFNLSVKLGFSSLPELDPTRDYYLSSVIPSWYIIAAMTSFTYYDTQNQLFEILNLRNVEEVICVIQALNDYMSNVINTDTLTVIPNGTYIFENGRYRLTSNFINILERIFAIQTTTIDFDDFINALNDINNFVRIKTDGQDMSISQVFYNSGPIRLLQVGPLYFKSTWSGCTLPQYQDNFYTRTNCILPNITYVRNLQCIKVGFSEYFDSLITEIDLEQGFKYVGIQPNRNVDIFEVANKLNYDSFTRERAKLRCKLTDISFPKLTPIQTKFNSRKAMQRTVGNIRLYDYNRAQIKGVSYGDPQLSITHGFQNIYWLQTQPRNQCPVEIPKPEAVSKNDDNVLVLIMRGNLVYMVELVQNVPRDSYQYLAQDIIGF